jgi:hypothetical protein
MSLFLLKIEGSDVASAGLRRLLLVVTSLKAYVLSLLTGEDFVECDLSEGFASLGNHLE